ncbi:MAG: hypothetical protein OXD41_07200 [Thaumarchaeota archaeon]|nr:hypothetical protein [Nitrososphaerota archaeon]
MGDRQRYWKLGAGEVEGLSYAEAKLINWDVRCSMGDGSALVGVFAYRHGTPVGYESVSGVSYYHNHVDDDARKRVTAELRSRYGGKPEEHSERVILRGSEVPYSGAGIASLARALESMLGAEAVIPLAFAGLTQDEQAAAGLPPSKLLPIVGTRSRGGG